MKALPTANLSQTTSARPSTECEAQNDSSQWADAMRAFTAADAACPPPANAIVFTGSSSIALWNTLRDDMAPLTVINRGFGGSTMSDLLHWLDTLVLRYRPRAIVLYGGDNDIGHFGGSPEQLLNVLTTCVSQIRSALPATRIYIVAIKPSICRWAVWPELQRANELLRAFCKTLPELYFIDVTALMLNEQGQPRDDIFDVDGLHMNARGYELWTSVVRPFLLRHEKIHESRTE